nr:helix-turn-helix transcriptional regulator [uncultured Flavonifractor sp.]
MTEKSTGDLTCGLMEAASIDSYIKENQDVFSEQTVAELLAQMHAKRNISKAALARRSGMSEVYLHQIFAGRRNPSRDRLLCLCMGLEATLEETQRLLLLASYAQLYPRNKRDAIISYGIVHRIPLQEINDKLFAEDETILF